MDHPKNRYKKLLLIAVLLLTTANIFAQKVVRYDLYVTDTIVNFTGKEKRAIAVNGQIPMPTFTPAGASVTLVPEAGHSTH